MPETRQHPWFARFYRWMSVRMESRGVAEHRDRLLAGLTGRVVEVGAGNGLNLEHYPTGVDHVLAVEPDDLLRAEAVRAARSAPVPVTVVAGQAESLPVGDGEADAVVASLVLCSVSDQAVALAEIRRVLRSGGELRFYEHVHSPGRAARVVEDALTPVWSRLAGGCHLNRDTVAAIRQAGFDVGQAEQFPFGLTHVLGRARRP